MATTAIDGRVRDVLAARIRAGAAWLDGRFPGWAGRIDMDRLSCRRWRDEPLVQLMADESARTGRDAYGPTMAALGGPLFRDCGFDDPDPDLLWPEGLPAAAPPQRFRPYSAEERELLDAASDVMTEMWAAAARARRDEGD